MDLGKELRKAFEEYLSESILNSKIMEQLNALVYKEIERLPKKFLENPQVTRGLAGPVPYTKIFNDYGGDNGSYEFSIMGTPMGNPKLFVCDVLNNDYTDPDPTKHKEYFLSTAIDREQNDGQPDFLMYDNKIGYGLRAVKLLRNNRHVETRQEERQLFAKGQPRNHELITKKFERWENCTLKTPKGTTDILNKIHEAQFPCTLRWLYYQQVITKIHALTANQSSIVMVNS
jgi:hypothetical protein